MNTETVVDRDLESIYGSKNKIRELLLKLAKPAADVCLDGWAKKAISVGFEYLRGEADVDALNQARAAAENSAWYTEYEVDRYAAWAVADALLPDGSNLEQYAPRVAWFAAKAVAYYKADRSQGDFLAAYEEAWSVHRRKQQAVVRQMGFWPAEL